MNDNTTTEQRTSIFGNAVGDAAPNRQAEEARSVLTTEQRGQAEAAAETITGGIGTQLFVQDLFSSVDSEEAVNGLLTFLDTLAGHAETLIVEEPEIDNQGEPVLDDQGEPKVRVVKQYRLTPMLRMTPTQVRDITHELSKLGISLGATFDVEQIGRRIAEDESVGHRVLAILYLPMSEKKYRRETTDARVQYMQDLELGQIIGALWRFFTGSGYAPRGAIRGYCQKSLVALVMRMSGILNRIARA